MRELRAGTANGCWLYLVLLFCLACRSANAFVCFARFEFQCADGLCVPKSYRCNKVKDCRDNSDEWDCPGQETQRPAPKVTTQRTVQTTEPSPATTTTTSPTTAAPATTAVPQSSATKPPATTLPPTVEVTQPRTTTAAVIREEKHHFWCASRGSFLPNAWMCDGTPDCVDKLTAFVLDEDIARCKRSTTTPPPVTSAPPVATTTRPNRVFTFTNEVIIDFFTVDSAAVSVDTFGNTQLIAVLVPIVVVFLIVIIVLLFLCCRRPGPNPPPAQNAKGRPKEMKVLIESGDTVLVTKPPPPCRGVVEVPVHPATPLTPCPAYEPVPMVTVSAGPGRPQSMSAERYAKLHHSSV